ncbi:MAG TPA: response regulator transcription factor [Anaerolineae bacterium]|nr:response regulator transcription factor [Anaerolineae bacterium]
MSLRILFVDKSVASSDLLVPGLERKGHEVSIARTLGQALGRLSSFHPDLLFVNAASFGRSAFRVCDGLQAQVPDVPRILVVKKECADVGGKNGECIEHPCSPRSLLYRVAKIAKTLVPNRLCAGPLSFDPVTRSLQRPERASVLRPKEAALLTFLMQHAGRVLTRQEIIHGVWDSDYVGDTRTLSVHVRWLREKIERDPHDPKLLRTVRGVGYRFEASEPGEHS